MTLKKLKHQLSLMKSQGYRLETLTAAQVAKYIKNMED